MARKKETKAEMEQRIENLDAKLAQAYQIIGALLSDCGLFETTEGQRVLDYFSRDGYDEHFLPWQRSGKTG
ncbi:hypothetical protein EN868_03210 [Mesorhizobium sp. M2D.F.Ca.ET.225.01.1.1]|uniref:hypothetical protein n=1 Tax=unclassified Mesorhizobium TaxID=325217 RepID=UPI000FD3EC4E|nr:MULTISPECIES: hypothetical protein [unclassified Mesorhizobium]TGP65470.1 hypothetical protein EN869_003215 [Mesorhizobium sp. M2D.F.Ca.ET.226.01.1.1]TGP71949.1 hypothetical protein EN868_03210 [Mesorhizobium sp. M2D.F.Ca.ET.225.01.1.1]